MYTDQAKPSSAKSNPIESSQVLLMVYGDWKKNRFQETSPETFYPNHFLLQSDYLHAAAFKMH